MRYRTTTISLIIIVITISRITLVSEAFIHPSKRTRDLTVDQSAGMGTTYYVDSHHPRAQDDSDHSNKEAQKTFQVFLPFVSKGNLPVFPGAEGFGINMPAGRGGRVIRVTTLADSGPGSLREALAASGPRTIVFEVGGIIWLESQITLDDEDYSYLTIAGQTAPPPGITIANAALWFEDIHDVLIQHIYFRMGDGCNYPSEKCSGISIYGHPESYNIVIDHCSFSWAVNKNLVAGYTATPRYLIHDITVSNCILSESLYLAGDIAYCLLIGRYSQRVAVVGNLFAHNSARHPVFSKATSGLAVNNVIYNPGIKGIHFGASKEIREPTKASAIGNVIITGPSTKGFCCPICVPSLLPETSRIYLEDNRIDGIVPLDPWDPIIVDMWASESVIANEPAVWTEPMTVRPVGEVLDHVLANAGARPWDRDAVDRRIVSDVLNGTGGIIDSQDDVGGWPDVEPTYRALDLPDRPNDDDDGDGYTNLEEWLHSFDQPEPTPTNTPSPTATSTPLPTHTPTFAPTNTPEPTNTPLPTNTPASTLTPTATNTPLPTYTPTPATTPSPTATSTPLPTSTPTFAPTNTPEPTNTPLPTNTPTSTPTSTLTPTATNTPLPTYTPTPATTPSPTATSTPLPTHTPTFAPTHTPVATNTP